MTRTSWLLPCVVLVAGGCAASASSGETSAALTVGVRVDSVPQAQIVGASADRRRVAYAWPCGPDASDPPSLAVRDDWTGVTTRLGSIARCAPNLVRFSHDGTLAAWPRTDGVAVVWNARSGRLAQVSRDGQSAIALAFAPDSRWLVVASTTEPPVSFLDAWDADLVDHTEVGGGIYVNPFGAGDDAVEFSPDSRRILYTGDVQTRFPVGALTEWQRTSPTSGSSRVLARGVAAYAADASWARVAFLDGVVVGSGPPSDWLHGRLAVERLDDGHLDVLERDARAVPQYFGPDGTLVYFVGPIGGIASAQVLRVAAPNAAPRTIDTGVFQAFAPLASTALSPDGGTLAYVAAFDQTTFSGELRVAPLAARGVAPTVVVKDVVPIGGFGWLDDTLGFLHASTSSFPGAALGTLGVWAAADGARDLASEVAQTGLTFDAADGRIIYVDHWDSARAAGDLRRFSRATGRSRLLAHDAFAMTLSWSPDAATAGVTTLGPQPNPDTPPRTTLKLAAADGPGGARTVARDVTSFVVGDGGRVLYTTDAGLWAAFSF